MAKSKDKTSHPKKGLDKEALIEGMGVASAKVLHYRDMRGILCLISRQADFIVT
jgi:hypothetical protein